MTHFWAFCLFERVTEVGGVQVREVTTILHGGRLLQQLVVVAGLLQNSSMSDGYELINLLSKQSALRVLLMHFKMMISMQISLTVVLYCHPLSQSLIAK